MVGVLQEDGLLHPALGPLDGKEGAVGVPGRILESPEADFRIGIVIAHMGPVDRRNHTEPLQRAQDGGLSPIRTLLALRS